MREHRLHVNTLASGPQVLHGADAHYIGTVRRAGIGEIVELFDGAGLSARATITHIETGAVHIDVSEPVRREQTGLRLNLAPALLKGDKLADVVRPATELGVQAFYPLITARADVKVLSPNRLARLTRITQEASRQSGRTVVPEVHSAMWFTEADLPGNVLVAQPGAAQTVFEVAKQLGTNSEITVVTGPEGGLTEAEVAFLETERSAIAVSLGDTILRAETAPVAIASALKLWAVS